MLRQLNDLLNLSSVPRWGIARMNRPQSVAEHSHRVAAIAGVLAGQFSHITRQETHYCMAWAVCHDASESLTGDPPAPFKDAIGRQLVNAAEATFCDWLAQDKAKCPEHILAIVKVADQIEGATWWELFGDRRMNHPWINPITGPVACNRTTVKSTCLALAGVIGVSPVSLIQHALQIYVSILGGEIGEATDIALEAEAHAFVRRHVESPSTPTASDQPELFPPTSTSVSAGK